MSEPIKFCAQCWKTGVPCDSIDHLDLPNSMVACLDHLGATTVLEAERIPEYLLLLSPNIGRKRVADLREKITAWKEKQGVT